MKYAYESKPVSEEEVSDIKLVRESFSELSVILDTCCPNGRYRSIVETKLEEAQMFAVKAITHKGEE